MNTVQSPVLVVKAYAQFFAMPVEAISEVMRPLPVNRLAGMPAYVLGLAKIRGMVVPVIDLAYLLEGVSSGDITRFVHLRIGARRVAVAVESVVGIRTIPRSALESLPAMLQGCSEGLEALGTLDERLVTVLRTARLVPDTLWAALKQAEDTSWSH